MGANIGIKRDHNLMVAYLHLSVATMSTKDHALFFILCYFEVNNIILYASITYKHLKRRARGSC